MQTTTQPHLATLLGKHLAGVASAEETAELRQAANGDEVLRRELELVEQVSERVRHSAIGEAAMIDSTLPPFSRPQQLAATLERLHAAQRRTQVVAVVALVGIALAIALVNGPAALVLPDALLGMLVGGVLLAAVVLHSLRNDPVRGLARLQALEGGASWLAQVQRIEHTRRRYASPRILVVAAGLLALGITAEVAGAIVATPLSESLGKFGLLASSFAAALLWFRHRQFANLPSND